MDDQPSATILPQLHDDRAAIVAEIHNRPQPELAAPARMSHLALQSSNDAKAEERRLLAELCSAYSALPPAEDALYHVARLGELQLRWERHTEFSTFTLIREGPFTAPFEETALKLFAKPWLERLPGRLVAANHVAALADDAPMPDRERLSELFEGHHLLSGRIQNEDVQLWTSLRVHADGFGRILVKNAGYDRFRLGRFVQRTLELETYRLMALLGLVQARRLSAPIDALETRLLALTIGMRDSHDVAAERELLGQLSDLAAEHATHASDSAFRFGATRAYAELVHERLDRLKLERNEDFEVVGSFLKRRFEPAMRTCSAVEERMAGLGERIGRAADLLRTRVDLALQEQNQALLTSMDRRAKLQLRLQQTVEGLSVAAVSYYIVGLWSYVLKLTVPAIGDKGVAIATGLAVPVVIIGVWLAVRRFRARIGH